MHVYNGIEVFQCTLHSCNQVLVAASTSCHAGSVQPTKYVAIVKPQLCSTGHSSIVAESPQQRWEVQSAHTFISLFISCLLELRLGLHLRSMFFWFIIQNYNSNHSYNYNANHLVMKTICLLCLGGCHRDLGPAFSGGPDPDRAGV